MPHGSVQVDGKRSPLRGDPYHDREGHLVLPLEDGTDIVLQRACPVTVEVEGHDYRRAAEEMILLTLKHW